MTTLNKKNMPNFEHTDLGNAKRWLWLYEKKYIYVPEVKSWYYWNNYRWCKDFSEIKALTIDKVLSSIKEDTIILEQLIDVMEIQEGVSSKKEIDKLPHPSSRQQELRCYYDVVQSAKKWYEKTQSNNSINAMFNIAAKYGKSVSYTEFDTKGQFLGVLNGVVKLSTGELIQNDPSYLITNSCNAKFDKEATCPNFEETINKAFNGNKNVIAFFQRVIGQCLLGTSSSTHLIILSGNGANLKSTIMDCIDSLLGDYSCPTTPDAIMGKNSSPEYYLAKLKGKRMTLLNESSRGAKLNEQMVKLLVDSGSVQAREIYGRPFSFQPNVTPILTTNFPPVVSSEYSLKRRVLFVPFEYKIPSTQRNPRYRQETLEPEMSGILNWAIQGTKMYLEKNDLNPPKEILDATNDYFFENDKIKQFMTEHYNYDSSYQVEAKTVYEKFSKWCDSTGSIAVGFKRFNRELRNTKIDVEKSTGGVFFVKGVRLKSVTSENEPTKQEAFLKDVLEW